MGAKYCQFRPRAEPLVPVGAPPWAVERPASHEPVRVSEGSGHYGV